MALDLPALFASGNALARQGRPAEAEAAYRGVLAVQPGHVDARYNLGVVLRDQGRTGEAEAAFRAALQGRPAHAEALNNLGMILMARREAEGAAGLFHQALAVKPEHHRALNNLGAALIELGRLDEAAAAFERAIALQPGHAKAHNNLGVTLQYLGRLDEAKAALVRAVAADPAYAEARANLAGLAAAGEEARAQIAPLSLRVQAEADPEARAKLLFALGRLHEQAGHHDEAFDAYVSANALVRPRIAFDIAAAEARLAAIAERFDAGLMGRLDGQGAPDARPIFVVGMPRSGTTLVEQILAAHPQVRGAGELRALGEAVAGFAEGFPAWVPGLSPADRARLGRAYLDALPPLAEGRTHITDKAVSNIELLGLIALCLPQATIVHVRRDPRDAAVSCFATRFSEGQGFAYDLRELGRYFRACGRLMDHWRAVLPEGRMLEIDYEALVGDLEGQARRLVAHAGLDWNPACLDFHRAERPVMTASAAQVRQPLYASAIGRWKRFEGRLGPLIEALATPSVPAKAEPRSGP